MSEWSSDTHSDQALEVLRLLEKLDMIELGGRIGVMTIQGGIANFRSEIKVRIK